MPNSTLKPVQLVGGMLRWIGHAVRHPGSELIISLVLPTPLLTIQGYTSRSGTVNKINVLRVINGQDGVPSMVSKPLINRIYARLKPVYTQKYFSRRSLTSPGPFSGSCF